MADSSQANEAALAAPSLPTCVEAEQTHLRLPSQPDWIQATADYLRNKAILCGACLEDRGAKLHLALIEALSNSVLHGNLEISSDLKEQDHALFAEMVAARSADPHYASRLVDVLVDYDGERCQWSITDEGPGFDVAAVLGRDPADASHVLLVTGRGILMMKAFLDGVRYEEGGRRVILTLARAPGAEKRRHGRTPLRQPLRIAPLLPDGTVDWKAAYEGVARNFSPEGIAFLQRGLSVSDRIIIGVPQADGRTVYLPAEVRHARTLGENVIELGCRFTVSERAIAEAPARVRRTVEEAMEELMERFRDLQSPHDERRIHARAIYTEQIEIRTRPEAEPVVGLARDLSKGGLAMFTSVPVTIGAALLSFPQGGGMAPLKIQAQIVRCDRILGGFYDVGARFLEAD
jgi:anti-sigma regulatory factor (Ser/Thr protein kinase)